MAASTQNQALSALLFLYREGAVYHGRLRGARPYGGHTDVRRCSPCPSWRAEGSGRALFPPAFLATARVGDGEYQFMAQWGQLLDRHGDVRPEARVRS